MADKRYVFLSYGRKDVYPVGATNAVEQEQHFPIVEKVYRHLLGLHKLNQLPFEPWFDKLCLTHDRQFTDSINHAIEQSDYMLLFIGKHSMASVWCEREWKHALANCVPVIPILLDGSWGDADIQVTYPESIRFVDGIDPQNKDNPLDDSHLLTRIVSAIQQTPAPLAIPIGARKLPEHYIERKQYVDELKKQLGVNDKNYSLQNNIVGITSQQETTALQGIGGIGKTTLAQAICADCEVRRGFDQIFWLEVGPDKTITDVPTLMSAVGANFGDPQEHYDNLQNARVRVQNYLRDKRSLIVLDDVWVEGLVEQFSWAGVDCRLLVTTRNKNLVEDAQQVAKLGEEEGLRLLATLFNPLNPNVDTLTVDHRAIVTLLDGYTLALTIAGKWLMKYGQGRATAYLARLTKGDSNLFKHLDMSKGDKNANLELSLSLSYDELEPDDQQRFRGLGVFATGSSFPLEALDAVWGTTDGFIEAQRLVDVGLLDIVTSSTGDERYIQHSLLGAYARVLTQEDEYDDFFDRYTNFYAKLTEQLEEVTSKKWNILDDDLLNVFFISNELVRKTETGQTGDPYIAFVWGVINLNLSMTRTGSWNIKCVEMGLNATRRLQEIESDNNILRNSEARFHNGLGIAWSLLGHKDKALKYLEQALLIDQELEDLNAQATTMLNIGALWRTVGELEKALDFYEKSLPIFIRMKDKVGEATTLNNIGRVWSGLGEKHKALTYYLRAIPMIQQPKNKGILANSLNNVGAIWAALGKSKKALNYYQEALVISQDIGDLRSEANILNNIATIYANNGQIEKSLEYSRRVLGFFKQINDVSLEASVYANMASTLKQAGRLDDAILAIGKTINILTEYELPFSTSGESLNDHEKTLHFWKSLRDGTYVPRKATHLESVEVLAGMIKLYNLKGEKVLRRNLKQAGNSDALIDIIVTQIKAISGSTHPTDE